MQLPSGLDDASLKHCKGHERTGLSRVKSVKELTFPVCLGARTLDLVRPVKSKILRD